MDSLMNAVATRSPAPSKKPLEVDFRSGATLDQLSSQVSELVLLEQGDFGDQTALEVHTAKDFIFNMLGKYFGQSLGSYEQSCRGWLIDIAGDQKTFVANYLELLLFQGILEEFQHL